MADRDMLTIGVASVGDTPAGRGGWETGHVAAHLPQPLARGPLVEVARGAALFHLPSVGRFLTTGDGPVRVDPAPGATDADVQCFVDGPVAALGALVTDRFALRAAAVQIGSEAVAICGGAAGGKSALAAALAMRGHDVLTDGVVIVAEPTLAIAVGPPGVTLWPDVVDVLGLDGGRVVRPGLAHRAFDLGSRRDTRPTLTTVVVLQIDGRLGGSGAAVELDEATGAAKVAALVSRQWFPQLIPPLGLGPASFAWLMAIAGRCRVVIARRARRGLPDGLPALADAVEAALR